MYCKVIEICSAKITQNELTWELKHSNSNVQHYASLQRVAFFWGDTLYFALSLRFNFCITSHATTLIEKRIGNIVLC